jgi:8-oxo-dGTP diphosphatase
VAPYAFAAVRDITGRMLLVRRCDTGDWELPGGHVDPGESASDAVRETAEESGIG